jgi:hypothetical protein
VGKRKIIKIKDGWEDAGRHGEQLGDPIEVNGMSWTPVLFQDEEDPDFFKTAALEPAFSR